MCCSGHCHVGRETPHLQSCSGLFGHDQNEWLVAPGALRPETARLGRSQVDAVCAIWAGDGHGIILDPGQPGRGRQSELGRAAPYLPERVGHETTTRRVDPMKGSCGWPGFRGERKSRSRIAAGQREVEVSAKAATPLAACKAVEFLAACGGAGGLYTGRWCIPTRSRTSRIVTWTTSRARLAPAASASSTFPGSRSSCFRRARAGAK